MPDRALEPLLDWDDIQGNILVGFNKDHQALVGLTFGDDVARVRTFVGEIADRVSSLHAIVDHKADRAAAIRSTGREPRNATVWTAAAFSFSGLIALRPDADALKDLVFRDGLPMSSPRLGDPTDNKSPGNAANWVVGAPGHIPDLLVVMASDDAEALFAETKTLIAAARNHGLAPMYHETGHDLSYYSDDGDVFPSGREHFGFKDGISQPGIRGRLPSGVDLTPRTLVSDPDDDGPEYAEHGKPLVCAGQFVLGYAQQVDVFPRQPGPPRPLGSEPAAIAPAWAANGSFLVFRRLRQYVAAFRAFADSNARRIARADLDAAKLAALVVGRWPSGASLIRSPAHDDPAAAARDLANAFAYGADNAMLGLPDDSDGVLCPVSAHVRKVNPRDGDTDIGAASATLTKRILRRGIPYGPPFHRVASDDSVDRGLLFLSYQASIADQFEFLTGRWMNSAALPRNPSQHPEGLGTDMLVGQGQFTRIRGAYLRFPAQGQLDDIAVTNRNLSVADWVMPTGGGYFFAPSISAIRRQLADRQ